jgi:hypothetical protein
MIPWDEGRTGGSHLKPTQALGNYAAIDRITTPTGAVGRAIIADIIGCHD